MRVRYRVYGIHEADEGKSVRVQLRSFFEDKTIRREFAEINITREEAKRVHIGDTFEMNYVLEAVSVI